MTGNNGDRAESVEFKERWQVVRQSLRDRIIDGSLRSGEPLSESELANHYGVSRGPIRTALQDLARVGLVEQGATRRRLSVAAFTRHDVDELFDVTLGLERTALRVVATERSQASVDDLFALLADLDAAQRSGDFAASIDADLAFHVHIIQLSGNSRLIALWHMIEEQIRFVISITQRSNPKIEWATFNHPIAEAIASADPERAEAAAVTCFRTAHQGLIEHWPDSLPVDAR